MHCVHTGANTVRHAVSSGNNGPQKRFSSADQQVAAAAAATIKHLVEALHWAVTHLDRIENVDTAMAHVGQS